MAMNKIKNYASPQMNMINVIVMTNALGVIL